MRDFLVVGRNAEAGGWWGHGGPHRLGVVAFRGTHSHGRCRTIASCLSFGGRSVQTHTLQDNASKKTFHRVIGEAVD